MSFGVVKRPDACYALFAVLIKRNQAAAVSAPMARQRQWIVHARRGHFERVTRSEVELSALLGGVEKLSDFLAEYFQLVEIGAGIRIYLDGDGRFWTRFGHFQALEVEFVGCGERLDERRQNFSGWKSHKDKDNLPAKIIGLLHCEAMRRRIPSVLGVSLLAAFLVACTPSPNPNAALAQMYQDALFDSQAMSEAEPELATLRSQHADELLAEIRRICGFDEGQVPESCQVAVPAIAILPTDDPEKYVNDSQALILDNLDDIPEDSVALVVEQYIAQAEFAEGSEVSVPVDLELTEAELAAAKDLADREFSAAWSLGVALAQLPETDREEVETAISNHHDRASQLQIITSGTTPAPGYVSELPDPTDETSARSNIETVENNVTQAWHAAASAATTDAWRVFCAHIAGDTARELTLIDVS